MIRRNGISKKKKSGEKKGRQWSVQKDKGFAEATTNPPPFLSISLSLTHSLHMFRSQHK